MIKKFIFIVILLIIIVIPNKVKAEKIICEYQSNYSYAFSDSVAKLKITYENNNLSYSLTADDSLLPNSDNITTTFKISVNQWNEMVSESSYQNKCPYKVVAFRIYSAYEYAEPSINYTIYRSFNDAGFDNVIKFFTPNTKKISFYCTNCSDGLGNMVIFNPKEYTTCEGILGTRLVNFINTILNYVKILVPVALIALGSFDIGRAVFAGNEDDMKKATKTFVRRLIIAVIIMFSPLLVNFMINVVNDATSSGYSGTCGID